MKATLLVFLGGGLGSLLRYGIYRLMLLANVTSAYGTLTVNILGSFLLGIILGYSLKEVQLSHNLLLFLATGFCGGFTTFSTFAYENEEFLRAGNYMLFFLYAFGSLFLGITAVILGIILARSL